MFSDHPATDHSLPTGRTVALRLAGLWALPAVLILAGCDSSDDAGGSSPQPVLSGLDDQGVFHVSPGESLQQAIDAVAANPDSTIVRVHAGTYAPQQSGQAFLHITAEHDGIILEADGEVVLSGSQPGEDGQLGTEDDVKVNHVVYFGDGISPKTVLRGFHITGAQPGTVPDKSGPPLDPRSGRKELRPGLFFYLDGGAIKIFGRSSPSIEETVIEDNESALCGGGVSVEQRGLHPPPVKFTSCVFRNNRCPATGSAVDLLDGSKAIFENCLFVNNISNYGMDEIEKKHGLTYNPVHGSGALTVFSNSRAEVRRCTFSGNWNGVDDHGSGSVYEQSIFWKNDASDGSRKGRPYEVDIIDSAGMTDCWIGGGVSDLRGTIDQSRNRLDAPDPQFDDAFRPQREELKDLGYRPVNKSSRT